MEILFWTAASFVAYTYLGYPCWLALKARLSPQRVRRGHCMPFLSVVIAACNEEAHITRKIDNLLEQDYPEDRYQILVVSDGSTDQTNQLVAGYAQRNVFLVVLPEKAGKAVALNQGVGRTCGEIVVFADVRQRFERDALRRLASNFADPNVGCVSGELILVDPVAGGSQTEMGSYWRYEKAVRRLESDSGSVVGATGAIYAIRRRLYRALPPGTILDDVLIPLNVVRQGYRAVFDNGARAYDQISQGLDQEWARKVRTLAGNLQLLQFSPSLALPGRSPLWWRFLSHKIFRLLVPFALCCTLAASLCGPGTLYLVAAGAQLLFYLTALVGWLLPPLRKLRPVKLAVFFVVINLAAVAGCWLWITGRCASSWRPAYAK
jgi:cellulose synthase/poly-beta-1,6-N-acetylglucosamine synthase-like glycosyltransferase